MPAFLALAALALLHTSRAIPPTTAPLDVLRLTAAAMLRQSPRNSTFFQYNYGPGYAFAALYEAALLAPDLNFTAAMGPYLDLYLQPGGYAFNITRGIPMPFTGAVGEPTSFAVAYAARARDATDWAVATRTADTYMLGYPHRLPDGTFVRPGGWGAQPGHAFLWGDDQFMALALLCRLSAARAPRAPAYLAVAVANALTNAARAQQPSGLFPHGFNTLNNESSCCAWGRANGWVAMSLVELLAALPRDAPARPAVLGAFARLAAGLARAQDAADGRWHQVLDDSATSLETSATAMFTFALATGVAEGWLPRADFEAPARAAWAGLLRAVRADGTVDGICEGTPVEPSAAAYNARTTRYNVSDPGLGAVFRAALAVERLARQGPPPPAAAAAAAEAAAAPIAAACRSPLQWPFNATSIWNTPIGSAARYEGTGLFPRDGSNRSTFGSFRHDDMVLIPSSPTDPAVPWHSQGHWGGPQTPAAYCNATGPVVGQVRIPPAFVWCAPGGNNAAAILLPNQRSVLLAQPAYICAPGAPLLALTPPAGEATADLVAEGGALGGHGGSGLSALGGALRLGEMLPGAPPISHALQVEFFAHLFYWAPPDGNRSDCFSWPANTCDGYALEPCSANPGCYGGRTRLMRLGALLAVPPPAAAALRLRTAPAQRLLGAFTRYGAYVVDDTFWNASQMGTERGVAEEFLAAYGFNWTVGAPEGGGEPSPWYADLLDLFRALRVVTSNGPSAPGGGGAPLAPPPPPFCSPYGPGP